MKPQELAARENDCNACDTISEILNDSPSGEFHSWDQAHGSTVRIYVEGAHCASCLWTLERLPHELPHILTGASLNLETSILTLNCDPAATLAPVAQKILEYGYTPHLLADEGAGVKKIIDENKKMLIEVGVAGALAGNIMLMSIPLYAGVSDSFRLLFESLSFALAIPSVFFSGRSFFKNVWSGIRTKTFPIDGPILLAILVAFFYSSVSFFRQTHELYFDSLSALIFLLLASRYYLFRLRQSSKLSLGLLDFFQPDHNARVGEKLELSSGQVVPFDAVLRSGIAWIDQAKLTGESEAVKFMPGDQVFAGTTLVSIEGRALFEVAATGSDTRISKILEKIKVAQRVRTFRELESDRLARGLLSLVTTVAVFALAYFIYRGQTHEGIKRVLALLIVTCPCALALATPLVYTLAIKKLLGLGILVKDPNALDEASHVKTIYFDKTGTLTFGKLTTRENLADLPKFAQEVLYSLVRRSRHPVSRAIERELAKLGHTEDLHQWNEYEEIAGLGIIADDFSLTRSDQSSSGYTSVVLKRRGNVITELTFEDKLRPESISSISELKDMGYETVLVSGDQKGAVEEKAHACGFDSFHARVSPEEKEKMVHDGLMIGDGVNDALALSSARVSIAVQGGMESAVQSAQIYSFKSGVSAIIPVILTSRRVKEVLRRSFSLSTSYNLIGGALAISGHMNPLIAAILMPLSAFTVFTYTMIALQEGDT